MEAALIVATDLSGGIAKDGKIPWRCKRDFKLFRQITMGHTLIMGRKTVESLPKHLDGRVTIRLSKTGKNDNPIVTGLKYDVNAESLEDAADQAQRWGQSKVFIAGGQCVYDDTVGPFRDKDSPFYVSEIHVSVIHGLYGCDKCFFIPDGAEWEVEDVRFHLELKDDPGFTYYKLVRK